MPVELSDPLSYDELTPEIVAARAAWGFPIHPAVIEQAQEEGPMWPRADAASCPPVEDCSRSDDDPVTSAQPPDGLTTESPSSAQACDQNTSRPSNTSKDNCAASQPLLIGSAEMSVTELQVMPDQPGAAISPEANMSPTPSALSAAGLPLAPEPSRIAAV